MKHSKWLLITVLILLVINIVFYAVWFAFDIQGKVKTKLETFLSKEMSGTFSIGKLSLNDRNLTANKITFIDNNKDIQVEIKQLQVRYNLLKVILSGFKMTKSINQITIYEPNVSYRYIPRPQKTKKPIKIPDLVPYFRLLEIKDGKFNTNIALDIGDNAGTKINFNESLHSINIAVLNRKFSDIKFSAVSSRGGAFNATTKLTKGVFENGRIQINHFKPSSIQITGFEDIGAEISIIANYKYQGRNTAPEISINSIIWDTRLKYSNYTLHNPYMHLNGDINEMEFDIRNCRLNDNQFSSQGSIYNPLGQASINGTVDIARFMMQELDRDLTGIASGKILVSGKFDNIKAIGKLSLPQGSYLTEKVSDLLVNASYSGDSLRFTSNAFRWREQLLNATGYYNIKQETLGLKVTTKPEFSTQDISLTSDLSAILDFKNREVNGNIDVNDLNIQTPYADITNLHGSAELTTDALNKKKTLLDVSLQSPMGVSLTWSGDVNTLQFKSVINLDNVKSIKSSPYLTSNHIDTAISGRIIAEMTDYVVTGNLALNADMQSPAKIRTDIISDFKYDINSSLGDLQLFTHNGYVKEHPFSLSFDAAIKNDSLNVRNINIDDKITAGGWADLSNLKFFGFKLKSNKVDFTEYWDKINTGRAPAPLSANVSFDLDYNFNNDGVVYGFIKADSCYVAPLKQFGTYVSLKGKTDNIDILCDIGTAGSSKISLQSTITRNPDLGIKVNSAFSNFRIEDVFAYKKTRGSLDGSMQWVYQPGNSQKNINSLLLDIKGNALIFQGFQVDTLQVKIAQLNDVLNVDKLNVAVGEYFNLKGKGSLDYNILTNAYSNGNHYLNLAFDGDVLKWINKRSKYIEDAKGKLRCQVVIKAGEDGLVAENGFLSLTRGMIKLQNQVEPVKNIELQCRIMDNQLKLDKGVCQIGEGKLYIRNVIDQSDDNFYVGPLNLGYFLLRTDDTGIQISIPEYIPPNTVITAILKGQNSKEATIKGPFDDMEIKGEITTLNGSCVYPANTKNLMQMVNLLRTKSESKDEVPLPFTLDLLIKVEENVRYVTYPANLVCLPGSFFRLTYDGNIWNAEEADFMSESGTIDFYGTIFSCEFVKVEINAKRNIIAINGTFIKKTIDGSLITLTVTTNPQKGGDFFNQLEFKLSSDNPDDKSPSQILSRLRYNKNIDELNPDQRQSLLQDEAMQLIGTSVNTTYISQWLSPVENRIRKFLRLDSFTINTGFIQNLYLQYGTDNQDKVSFSDPQNLNADIMQFSSSVFLNNLSVTMSKYLSNNISVDYQIQLQETTDLAKKTKLVLYHNAAMRFNLPWKLRLAYTFSLKPANETNSHEIMLQRSFRF